MTSGEGNANFLQKPKIHGGFPTDDALLPVMPAPPLRSSPSRSPGEPRSGESDSPATMSHSQPPQSAHPLFPADQVLLWLPGFSGVERPYCTYNESREHPGAHNTGPFPLLPECDGKGAPFIPPFPVSSGTYITWHTHVTPPYPYHPVPLERTLSVGEMEDLGRRVIRLLGEDEDAFDDPRAVLRNEFKFHILAVLAAMELLQKPSSEPMSADYLRSAS